MLNPSLKSILINTFELDDIDISDSIETVDIWDSMAHMEIMISLEEKYSIKIEPVEIVSLTSVASIQEFLKKKNLI